MAQRLLSNFGSDQNSTYLLSIGDSSYGGSTSTFKCESISVRWVNDDPTNRFSPILGSEVRIRMIIDNSTLQTFVDDLVTAEEGRFTVNLIRIYGLLQVNEAFSGYILPDLVTIDDIPTEDGYIFEIRATDGVAKLKTILYNDAGSAYTGKATFNEHLLNCINKLSFITEWYDASDTVLNVVCNWHSTAWTYAADKNPLVRTRCDHKVFIEIDRYGNNNYFTCYDVIKKICETWGARFLFSGQAFWFVQLGEYRNANNLSIFEYTKTGGETANTSQDISIIHTPNDDSTNELRRYSGGKYRFFPPLNQVRVLNRMYDIENLAAGESWDQGSGSSFTIEGIDSNDGTAEMAIQINFTYITDWNTGLEPFRKHWFVMRLTIQVGSNYLTRSYSISAGNVTYGTPTWSGSSGYFYLVGFYRIEVDGSAVAFSYNRTENILTPPIPADGDMTFNVEYYDSEDDSGFSVDTTAGWISSKTWSVNNTFIEILSDGTFEGQSSFYEYGHSNTASTANSQEVVVYTDFSANRLSHRPGFLEMLQDDDVSWTTSGPGIWSAGNDGANLTIPGLLSREILRGQITPVRFMLQMPFQTLEPVSNPMQPHKAISYDSAYWVCQRAEYDLQTEIWKGEWWKMQDSASYSVNATVIRPPGAEGSGGAVGGGANPVGQPGTGSGGGGGSSPGGGGPGSGTGGGGGSGGGGGGSSIQRHKETVTSTGAAALPAVSTASLPSDETLIDVFQSDTGQKVNENDFTVAPGTGVITLSWTPASGEKFTIIWWI